MLWKSALLHAKKLFGKNFGEHLKIQKSSYPFTVELNINRFKNKIKTEMFLWSTPPSSTPPYSPTPPSPPPPSSPPPPPSSPPPLSSPPPQ